MWFSDYEAGEWIDCEFTDNETGETFFVELQKEEGETASEFIARCEAIAIDNFDEPEFQRLVDPEEAEMLGYDTY